MPADRKEIIAFCDELLEIERFTDYGPNGLQVPGADRVSYVVSGVSAHLELIEAAVALGSEPDGPGAGTAGGLLLAHHGLFWEFHPRALSEQLAARLHRALAAGLNLAGYHLPLDAHPEIGNNALLCERLGLEAKGRFASARGEPIGVIGHAPEPIEVGRLTEQLGELLGRAPLLQGAGPQRVERVGIVSGAGGSFVAEAVELGLDALITGEPAEHVMADAREGGIHFYAAGHYATETFGIRRLGELVGERFGLPHSFVDVPNPV